MKKNILLLAILLSSFSLLAQQIKNGRITYKAGMKPLPNKIYELMMNDTMDADVKERVLQMYDDNKQVKSVLEFTDTESVYYVKGEKPKDINLSWIMAGGESRFYNNLAEGKRFYNFEDSMAHEWLLISYDNYQWQITEETKEIKGYTCYKAIQINTEKKKKRHLAVAWFTKELPFAIGPKDFGGLPGIILELTVNTRSYVVDNIELNVRKVRIAPPLEGRKITRKEFRERYKDFFGKSNKD